MRVVLAKDASAYRNVFAKVRGNFSIDVRAGAIEKLIERLIRFENVLADATGMLVVVIRERKNTTVCDASKTQ